MNYVKSVFTAILVLVILLGCSKEKEPQLPNIVFILADDMGADVFDAYGGTSYNTPNIDALGENGLTFNQCYSAPVCSPSRVKLLTGRYGFRTGQTWGTIPEDEITFGHLLKEAGYKTAISGKWQLALLKDDPIHIKKMGFDESCVFGWHEGSRYYEPMIYQNGVVKNDIKDTYGPDVYLDFLVDFIERNKSEPFFAYYSMTLAHEISNDFENPPPFGELGRYETFKENVEKSDQLIGELMKALKEMQLLENTIVIFTGDNGTPHHYIIDYKDGDYVKEEVYSKVGDTLIQGGKSYLTNAGTHVPLYVSWPHKIKAGSSSKALIDFSDFMPTFAELTSAKLPTDRKLDGKSFKNQLLGKNENVRDWVYQLWEEDGWIRNEKWKLYESGALFDMKNDPFEQHPISKNTDYEASSKMRSYFENELKRLKE